MLALVTLLAMGTAAVLPSLRGDGHAGGSPAAQARTAAYAGQAPTAAARPAPLHRATSDRHAQHPPTVTREAEAPVAETDSQADQRAADGQRGPLLSALLIRPAPEPTPTEPTPEAAPEPPAFPEGRSRLFARHDGVHLYTPSADPVHVGFHEASYPQALGMIPLGQAVANDNMTKYTLPPLTPTEQRYLVMSSRLRPHHATSAVDLVMRPGEPVRSVVTGMVIEARPYALYGRYPDGLIRIRSAEDPGKVITMLHVTGIRVHVGQQILAGDSIVADSATRFPFRSQIDDYLGGEPRPHVHVELRRG